MKFHHLGIACRDINDTLQFVHDTRKVNQISEIIYDKNQDAYVCLVETDDGIDLELISGPKIQAFLKKGVHLYHTCWEVDDIQKAINELSSSGATLISEPKEAELFNNRLVAFLSTPIGFLELLEDGGN